MFQVVLSVTPDRGAVTLSPILGGLGFDIDAHAVVSMKKPPAIRLRVISMFITQRQPGHPVRHFS